jgi:site-specific recombinase XerC
MQMNGKAKRELQDLINANNWRHGRKNKGVSYSTEASRAETLWLAFKQLFLLNRPMMPRSFRLKHVTALVHLWEEQGLHAATMQTRLSHLRTFCSWIGKAGMISGTLADYLTHPESAKRIYAAQHDKSWPASGIDVSAKIAEIARYDRYVGAQLGLQRALGLRAKEACMCRPWESDQGTVFHVLHGTKGGRPRFVPIDNAEKRAAIDLAKSLVKGPTEFLGNPAKSLKQNKTRYHNVLTKFGVTRAELGVTGHGLRAGYGLDLYEQLTGVPAPVRGGTLVPPETDSSARLQVADHYGHGRTSISTAYLGSVLQEHARQPGTTVNATTEAHHDHP